MCLTDWRLGRLTRSIPSSITVAFGTPMSIAASSQRVAIRLSISSTITPVFDSIAASNPSLIVSSGGLVVSKLDVFNRTELLSFITHGDMPSRAFTISIAASSLVLSVIEWFLPEEVIQEALENLKREYPRWTP